MKRFISLVSLVIMFLISFMPIFADSTTLSDEERTIIAPEDKIWQLTYYDDYFLDKFARKQSIYDMIPNSQKYYLLKGNYVCVIKEGNKQYVGGLGTIYDELLDFFMQYYNKGELLLKNISVTAEVKEVYALYGNSYDGGYIYYVTDKGDYILYTPFPLGIIDDMYIFPLEEFCTMAQGIIEESSKEITTGGRSRIDEMYDVSEYKVTIKSYVPTYLCIGGICILIIGCTLYYFFHRRKT